MKKRFGKGIWTAALVLALVCVPSVTARADMPYETYSYNYWGEEVVEPHSYLYTTTIDDEQLGSALSYPQDMYVGYDHIYIADTGNSRVLVTDMNGNTEFAITDVNAPQGIFVTEEGHIYVADTGNHRVVEYDETGAMVREIGRPETTLISDSQEYSPTKVVVDKAGRVYVIAYGINMGLVEFDKNGVFQGFMGATEVSVSTFEYIWKNYFSTEAQQQRMETIVPTEYSNIFVDGDNFIYATINNLSDEDWASGADVIRRLNPTGVDVLRRLGGDIIGDQASATYGWDWSSFVDVAATDYGCYFVLDATDGKIFAYDYDGISLFVFGRTGIKEGNFQKPVAIGLSDDASKIYVLDNLANSILVFDITDYGASLLDAIRYNSVGDSGMATQKWEEVLKANSNSELAYTGLGKAYLSEGSYKKAMECFELGNSKKYYTKAFTYYRKEVMETYLTPAVIAVAVVLVLVWLVKKAVRFKKWVGDVKCYMEKP